jgi:hypothetical protein
MKKTNPRETEGPNMEKQNGRAKHPGPILPFTRRMKVCQFDVFSIFS